MDVSRRRFINSSTRSIGGLTGLLAMESALGASSLLEQATLPSRQLIGTLNDNLNNLGVVEMYSNGMFLTQKVDLNAEYSAEVLYLIRDGKTEGSSSEWSVRCDLYKKGTPAAVNSVLIGGSVESGKLAISNRTKPDQKNLVEATLVEGVYTQSSMQNLERFDQASTKRYMDYFRYQLTQFRTGILKKNDTLNPMPQGYNPLAK